MKPLNHFIVARGFKMATIKMVAQALRPGDFVISLDLSNMYFHVWICLAFRRFLRFFVGRHLFQF